MYRFWSIFVARNKEYYRDRASFGWNIMFPFLIIFGFALLFQNGGQRPYKVAILTSQSIHSAIQTQVCSHDFFSCIPIADKEMAIDKLNHHQLDMVMENLPQPFKYWINASAPKGILSESLLTRKAMSKDELNQRLIKQTINSKPVYYIEWLFPGIISMGMMFSSLFGIGFTIVRYRQNGVLKRLKATPLTSFEYLCAQITSRLLMILITNIILYFGCSWLLGFQCRGSLIHLLIFFTIGTISVISLGLIVAARTKTEELAHGLLNIITWPMMFLSEVWFSIADAPQWIKRFALCLPLSHVTSGLRHIMNDGAHLFDLSSEIFYLSIMTIIFLFIGSIMFKWTQ
jgi:ABC transporter DrrB family efflux protein